MNVRHAACEPCRRSKLACGHEQPTCKRCGDRGQAISCVYRPRPFRRRHRCSSDKESSYRKPVRGDDSVSSVSPGKSTCGPNEAALSSSVKEHRYPNPGYLGISSHSTLFNHVSSATEANSASLPSDNTSSATLGSTLGLLEDQAILNQAMQVLDRLERLGVSRIMPLVQSWLARGVNLPLAGPFVVCCLHSVEQWSSLLGPTSHTSLRIGATDKSGFSSFLVACARTLTANTQQAIITERSMSTQDYMARILGENLRWEVLGIFFTAASRAAYDTTQFPGLYVTNEQRQRLIRTLTYVSDCCLEICLKFDSLNELQLVLQYENLIAHSQVKGDQSYSCWRRMGDLASSLFALGYHERTDGMSLDAPPFIIDLRKACVARIYSADKNLAIFLGRPPRIVKEYCHLVLPSEEDSLWGGFLHSSTAELFTGSTVQLLESSQNGPRIDYIADTRCSALFALLKEEVLQLLHKQHISDTIGNISELRSRAVKQWEDLPENYRLTTSLRECQRSPFERDFLAGMRLDYLHVHLLLGLVSQKQAFEPDDHLLTVANEMLSLIVDVVILRDQLVNSGTCLVWKVAQYGLPAAGIISVALLRPATMEVTRRNRSKMIQNLSVLVAEVATGAWKQEGEPNFALFTRATRTIQTLLDSLLAPEPPEPHGTTFEPADCQDPYTFSQYYEFEMDFWTNLAEHPTLLGELNDCFGTN